MFHSQKARQILKQHGAKVDDGSKIVNILEELVKQALYTAPQSFTLGARATKKDFHLPSTHSGYVLDNGGIYIRDFKTGQRRLSNIQDNIDILYIYDKMQLASVVWPTTVHEFVLRSATVKTTIASYMHTSLHIQDELEEHAQIPFIIEALETRFTCITSGVVETGFTSISSGLDLQLHNLRPSYMSPCCICRAIFVFGM